MRIITLACCVPLLLAGSVNAQTLPVPGSAESQESGQAPPRLQLGIGALVGLPKGEFSDNVESSGGLSGHMGYRLGETPVSLGVEVGFLWYGNESRKVPFSLTIPDVLVDVNTNNYFILTHGRVRVQPRLGFVRPYVDGLFGFNYIFTRTTVDFGDFDEQTIATTNLDDFTPSYGGGGGVMINFPAWPDSLTLDFSVRYLYGSEAQYLTQGSIRREEGQATLDVTRSRTDLLNVYIGVAVDF